MSKLEYFRKIIRNLSRAELSEKSGIPISRITRLENLFVEATLSDWNALAKALQVPLKSLVIIQPGNGLVPREKG